MTLMTVAEVTALYGRQSQAIDDGAAADWAACFTADGSFHSPTYGEPIVGTEALTAFAAGVYQDMQSQGLRQRHWINNVVVDAQAGTASAYLMIVRVDAEGTPSLLRHVVFSDQLAVDEGQLKVRARSVRRDP